MNKSITVKAKTELLSTAIGAFNNAEDATALVWAKYDALIAAGIEPSYFESYYKKGGNNKTLNEKCTATKEQAEAIAAEFLYHHKDRDMILEFKALTKEDIGNKTVNEIKEYEAAVNRPATKRGDFRKAYAKHIERRENAALKEAAKNDPEAAKQLDEKLDNDFKAKQLKALSASAKQAKDKLSEDEYSQVNAAYKTLVAFYNS